MRTRLRRVSVYRVGLAVLDARDYRFAIRTVAYALALALRCATGVSIACPSWTLNCGQDPCND